MKILQEYRDIEQSSAMAVKANPRRFIELPAEE